MVCLLVIMVAGLAYFMYIKPIFPFMIAHTNPEPSPTAISSSPSGFLAHLHSTSIPKSRWPSSRYFPSSYCSLHLFLGACVCQISVKAWSRRIRIRRTGQVFGLYQQTMDGVENIMVMKGKVARWCRRWSLNKGTREAQSFGIQHFGSTMSL